MIVAATGHRPEKLGGHTPRVRLALGGLATEYLFLAGPEKVIVGMALGWDQAVALAAIAMRIPFIAAVPFAGQELIWPQEDQERYRWILDAAEDVVIVSEGGFSAKAMQVRNEWMVDRCSRVAALWDGSTGGTFNCVKDARRKHIPVDHLWARWSQPADLRELLS